MHFQSFQWVIDINADGSISMWELWETLRWIFRLPGSVVVELMGQYPALAQTLGIQASAATGYASLNGLLAKVLSFLFWLPLFVWVLNVSSKPKRRHAYLDEQSQTQPLLLPMPKGYMHFHYHGKRQ